MVALLLYGLAELFLFQYRRLCKRALKYTDDGLNEVTRPKWNQAKTLITQLFPWTGFVRFVKGGSAVLFIDALSEKYWSSHAPISFWFMVAALGLLYAYGGLLPPFYRWVKQCFKGDEGKSRPRWWLIKMRWSHVTQGVQFDYPYTFAFFTLAKRLLLCNVFGHKWGKYEHIKYGDFGQYRTCKHCLINDTLEKGEHRYYETHSRSWNQIKNPNSVFFRKYFPKP